MHNQDRLLERNSWNGFIDIEVKTFHVFGFHRSRSSALGTKFYLTEIESLKLQLLFVI